MLTNLPFDGNYPIIQQFGDSARTFRRVSCAGEPLRGHHGIDFATPDGLPIVAVADGVVADTQYDRLGFGIYIILEHEWGQSFYAHLARIHIRKGDSVRAGDTIGRSGHSGLCPQPHLHFGLRINPYELNDRWCGYTDPAPYLQRIRFGRGPLLGPHVIGGVHKHLDLMKQWQPRLITVLKPNIDEMRDLRRTCPNSVIVGRIYLPMQPLVERIRLGPKEAARWAHEQTLPQLTPDVDYWQVVNELHQDEEGLVLLNRFELERMRLADEDHYRCALFGFSVGNPDLPKEHRMQQWELLYPALTRAEASGHIVALHQYGAPDLWGPHNQYNWYLYRLEHQVLRRLPYKQLQFAITETGIDGMLIDDKTKGWQELLDSETYVQQLLQHSSYSERYSGRVLGASVFTHGANPPWQTYDIEGEVSDALAHFSSRGTWDETKLLETDIVPDDFQPSLNPGVEAIQDVIQEPENDSDEQPPEKPETRRRLDPRFVDYNLKITRIKDRPDRPEGSIVYVVKDAFFTTDGSWETDGRPGELPLWARNDYLRPEFLEAGADHHLFGAVLGLDGELIPVSRLTFWSDGLSFLDNPDYYGFVRVPVNQQSGWANIPLSAGSCYYPDQGESGPWCWMPDGASEVICGGGLPLLNHVSTFVVWQAMRREDYEASKLRSDAAEPIAYGTSRPIVRRLSLCVPYYRLQVRPLLQKNPGASNQPSYMLRDLFTVSEDINCADTHAGVAPSWATKEYDLPRVQPGWGARATLYAAVRNRDGILLPGKEIAYARSNYSALRDASHEDRIVERTDAKTLWAHLDVGAEDAYSIARMQTGPWSWAPEGAREAVTGGGVPDGKHVAIFAVWEEVD